MIDIFLNREQISNNSISNRDLTFFQIVSGSSVIDLCPETKHDKLVTTRAKVKARRKIQGKNAAWPKKTHKKMGHQRESLYNYKAPNVTNG